MTVHPEDCALSRSWWLISPVMNTVQPCAIASSRSDPPEPTHSPMTLCWRGRSGARAILTSDASDRFLMLLGDRLEAQSRSSTTLLPAPDSRTGTDSSV